jgi:hypothetical protein
LENEQSLSRDGSAVLRQRYGGVVPTATKNCALLIARTRAPNIFDRECDNSIANNDKDVAKSSKWKGIRLQNPRTPAISMIFHLRVRIFKNGFALIPEILTCEIHVFLLTQQATSHLFL